MKTFLKAKWENIVMVNYVVDPSILQPYMPFGVDLDTFENKVFVSLVGFQFRKSSIFGIPIPWLGSFDEINLRFYVKRKEGAEEKRGVVFISEIVPSKMVSFLANTLYKEHYSDAKMKSKITVEKDKKKIRYDWFSKKKNNVLAISCLQKAENIQPNSLEEFIYEHYYGYTKVSESETWEYKVNHPRWQTNEVVQSEIHCDFAQMYGTAFACLNKQPPLSVYHAIGSSVTIDWKINKLNKSTYGTT